MKSAVLVIDVQSLLFDPEPKPYASEEVLSRINLVTDWARKQGMPVIYIQHEQNGTAIEYGSEGWQLQSVLQVDVNDQFVRKTTPDSFLNTNLSNILEEHGAQHIYVCGYATEFCVDTTSRRAAGLGYAVTLVADAHTTHCKKHMSGEQIRIHHNATLPNISSFGVKISAVSTAKIIALGD
ncbi:cysteine hydrolase family protein [Pseudoalteromonas piscicida]|uniref:cysteine hydrolase family protein n=1 Tax=Pseudoalteromonas piscicida TaxID=43662 RepID=UPI001C951BBC|nr:cysteine hydrolase family protein [Pseudoalteromonas piscicida]QZO15549.1 cysteine hydrolase [Pseudoalteromonas piscicida]